MSQVEQLLGDPTKAKTKLGWTPRVRNLSSKTTLSNLTKSTKTNEFSENFRGGEGHSNPKIYVAKFGLLNRAFWHENDTKGSFQGMFFNQLPC